MSLHLVLISVDIPAAALAHKTLQRLPCCSSINLWLNDSSMARVTVIFIALVAAYACTSSASDVVRSGGRTLLATSLTAQGCTWSGYVCEVNPNIAFNLTATDDKTRLAKKVAAMNYKCSSYNTSTTCESDTSNSCSWDQWKERCRVGGDWTDTLACPGTKAVDALKCAAASAKADCEKISTCAWKVPTQQEFESFLQQAATLAQSIFKGGDSSKAEDSASESEDDSLVPKDGACVLQSVSLADYVTEAMAVMTGNYSEEYWGACAGVQLLKTLRGACKATTEAACKAENAGCIWTGAGCETGDELIYLLTSADNQGEFDKSIEKVAAACTASTNETTCIQAGDANKGTFTDAEVTNSLAYTQAAKSGADVVSRAFVLLVAPLIAAALMLA